LARSLRQIPVGHLPGGSLEILPYLRSLKIQMMTAK
jgi:hypothetical protein